MSTAILPSTSTRVPDPANVAAFFEGSWSYSPTMLLLAPLSSTAFTIRLLSSAGGILRIGLISDVRDLLISWVLNCSTFRPQNFRLNTLSDIDPWVFHQLYPLMRAPTTPSSDRPVDQPKKNG